MPSPDEAMNAADMTNEKNLGIWSWYNQKV